MELHFSLEKVSKKKASQKWKKLKIEKHFIAINVLKSWQKNSIIRITKNFVFL